MTEPQIPIQAVENPILCSPYQEPDQYWPYDSKTGVPSKAAGRRPVGYWYKTERTGSAQTSIFYMQEILAQGKKTRWTPALRRITGR